MEEMEAELSLSLTERHGEVENLTDKIGQESVAKIDTLREQSRA